MTDGPESYAHDGFSYLLEPETASLIKEYILSNLDGVERLPGVTLIKRNHFFT